jgi:hypothetical protein
MTTKEVKLRCCEEITRKEIALMESRFCACFEKKFRDAELDVHAGLQQYTSFMNGNVLPAIRRTEIEIERILRKGE